MMSTSQQNFREASFIKAKLFQAPIYRTDDEEAWIILRNNVEEIRAFFRQVGQEVVFDEGEGYAFISQMNAADGERVPRLVQSRPLNYETTLLLVFLREELDRFESSGTDSTRLVHNRDQLRVLVEPYVRSSSDQARDRNRIDQAIERAVRLGFLRKENGEHIEEFQIMRIIKARFGAAELQLIKERLIRYAEPEQ
jgi:hypothetical protein